MILLVNESRTTAAVQHYLDELAGIRGDAPAEPIIRALLARSVNRLHLLCAGLLHRSYPRLMRGPLNLQPEEMLSAVVERLIKAMRQVHPQTVRQFFALVNQHMRWELNDLARRLDHNARPVQLRESFVAQPNDSTPTQSGEGVMQILAAIEALPEDEREVISLVRIQELTQAEAADILGVSTKTVQRRLIRGVALLAEQLKDLPRPSRSE